MSKIGAEYDELGRIAGEINKLAQDYVDTIGSFYNIVDELEDVWLGCDNSVFKNTAYSYQESLNELGEVINDYANFLILANNTYSETQNNIADQARRI